MAAGAACRLDIARRLERYAFRQRAKFAHGTRCIADFHAAGRHSHVTELLRSGASLPEARELARHSDIRTTMKYTHIGMNDRARALGNLRWQRIGSEARDVRSHQVASNDNEKSSARPDRTDESDGRSRTCDAHSHSLATDGNEPANGRKRVRFSPPPLSNSLNCNGLLDEPNGLAASGQRSPDAASRSVTTIDVASSTLRRLIEAWPFLPPHIREAILTLIDASLITLSAEGVRDGES